MGNIVVEPSFDFDFKASLCSDFEPAVTMTMPIDDSNHTVLFGSA